MKLESIHSEKFGKFSSVQLDSNIQSIKGGYWYTDVVAIPVKVDRFDTQDGHGGDGSYAETWNSEDHWL
ncbi:MAG: hypothetical protein ABI851_01940 [Saprospiraceae bacterium]